MRPEQEVKQRVRSLLGAELDRRVQEASERLPTRCVHNHRQPLDSRKQVEGYPNPGFNLVSREGKVGLPVIQTVGLCMLGVDDPEEWRGTICDEPIDAKRCPDFTPAQSKDALLATFKEEIQDLEWLLANLPEVHTLLWVLGAMDVPHLPWWRRLWFYFLRIQVESIQPPFDPTPLLESLERNKEEDLDDPHLEPFGCGGEVPTTTK